MPITTSGDNLPSSFVDSDEASANLSLTAKKGPDYCGSCYGAAADANTFPRKLHPNFFLRRVAAWCNSLSGLFESPMVSYFLKLVPTLYLDSNNNMLTTHQYSATWQTRLTPLSGAPDGVPGVFFNYEISPLLVKLTEERKSFLHFLTNTCAIIGGVFTVASLLDAFIYRSLCLFEKVK
nr:unnamed protein product [Spirometra erinaceieuropaei]